MRAKPKVFLLHSEISPYRLPLFEELSKNVNLHVYFCKAKSKKRLWDVSVRGHAFKNTILKSISIGPLIINYSLPVELLTDSYDVYIIDDDPRLTLSKLLTFVVAKILHKPVIVWSGAIEDGYYSKPIDLINRYLFASIRRFVYHYADAFLTYGTKTAEFLTKNGVPEEKIYVGTQSVSESQLKVQMEFAPKDDLKRKLGFENKKIILFLGYFIKRKGVFELMEAYRRLNRDDTVLIMVGAGREEMKLKSLAGGRKDVHFPGYATGTEKANYYAIADIFVLPSHVDTWPMVILEAMVFKLPIITTTGAGCTKELIRKGNIIAVEPGDVNALTISMERLLSDSKMRREMASRSAIIIKEYSIERRVRLFMEAVCYCIPSHLRTN